MAQKNATYNVYNGSGYDEIMLKTLAEQVIFASGKNLTDIGTRETLWSGIVWLKNAVMNLTQNLQYYNCIQLEVIIDNTLRIFDIDLDETTPFSFIVPRITAVSTWQIITLVVKKSSNTQISVVESYLTDPNNVSDSWANDGEAKIIKVTGIRRA